MILIREPKKTEYQIVNNLITQAFKTKSEPIALAYFSNPDIHCFVAVNENTILGTGSLHIIQKSNRKMGLIEDVVVDPNAQGMGIVKKLIEKLLKTSVALDCYKTILNSTEETAGFYSKLDFKKEQLQLTIRH